MENKTTTPVDLVIKKFGGIRKLGRAIGRDPAAICRWRKRGLIPSSAQALVLNAAHMAGIDLTANQIVFGND